MAPVGRGPGVVGFRRGGEIAAQHLAPVEPGRHLLADGAGGVGGADSHGFGCRLGLGGGDRPGFLLAGEVGGGGRAGAGLAGIVAAGRRIGDAAHAAGIVAAVVAGVLGEAVVDLLGGQAGIGGVEQHAFRHLEVGGGEQRVDGVIAGDVPAPEVAPLAPVWCRAAQCIVSCAIIVRSAPRDRVETKSGL